MYAEQPRDVQRPRLDRAPNATRWIIAAILLGACLLASSLVTLRANAEGGAVVKIVPPNSTVNIGRTVVVSVIISNVSNLAGAEVHLTYDPFLLEARIEPGGFPSPDYVLQSSATGGRIDFSIRQIPEQHSPVSGSGDLLKITFKGLAAGASVLHITSAVLSDGSGAIIPSTTQEGSVTTIPSGGSIRGKVLRQGVPPSTGPGTLACTQITAKGGGNTFATLTDKNGDFSLGVPAGRYTVTASYPGYLSAEKCCVDVPPDVNLGPTRLHGGDVNGDNNINILDIVAIIGRLGRTGVEVRSDPPDCNDPDDPYDVNDDGRVDISDLSIAAGNFGKPGPTPWAP